MNHDDMKRRLFLRCDGVRDWKILGIGKGATYFNPRLIELQHEFTRNLLTHKNPYTGLEYRHEPAIVTIEMVNENSLLEAWGQWRQNTRQRFAEDGKTLAEWGNGPTLIEPLVGIITLRNLADAKSVQAIVSTVEGRPAGRTLNATRTDAGWNFTFGEPATTWWVLEVNR